MFYVYAYCNPKKPFIDGDFRFEPFYIGKGSGHRIFDQLREAKNKKPGRRLTFIRSLIAEGLEPVLLKISDGLSEDEAFQLEKKLISKFGRKDLKTGCLLNFTPGGDGAKHPQYVCDQISKKLKGRKLGTEHIQKISNGLKGKPRSQEAKNNISTTMTGTKHTAERRKAIIAGMVSGRLKLQKKWLVTTPETSFCLISLDYLREEKIEHLSSTIRTGKPISRGKFKGWQITQIITS